MKNEGLCLGGSSAINVAGAIRLAKDLGPGSTVVTILADSGTRYQSKLFNRASSRRRDCPSPTGFRFSYRSEAPTEAASELASLK